jgi:hypothetical protein
MLDFATQVAPTTGLDRPLASTGLGRLWTAAHGRVWPWTAMRSVPAKLAALSSGPRVAEVAGVRPTGRPLLDPWVVEAPEGCA